MKWRGLMALYSLNLLHPGEGTAERLSQFWMNWVDNMLEG
jgi:hypothetical protein